MWCNLIRRKIRLNLSDQEIKSNQIRLNWLGQNKIFRNRVELFCCSCQWSIILFLAVFYISFYFLPFLFISFYLSHLFFTVFLSPSYSLSFFLFLSISFSQYYHLIPLQAFYYPFLLTSQNSWIDSKTVISRESISSSTFAYSLPPFTALFKNYLLSNFKIHQCVNVHRL